MTEQEWNSYIDTGDVPFYFIKEIANGIRSGQRLNTRHLQVYMTHGPLIESILNKKDTK